MAKKSDKLQAYADHEIEAAERMKWWGVFLVREKRRLDGIAKAVHSNTAVKEGIFNPIDEDNVHIRENG